MSLDANPISLLVEPRSPVSESLVERLATPAWLALIPAALAVSFFLQAYWTDGSMPWHAFSLDHVRVLPDTVLPTAGEVYLAMAWMLALPAIGVGAYLVAKGLLALRGYAPTRGAVAILGLSLFFATVAEAGKTLSNLKVSLVAVSANDAGYAKARSVLAGKGMAEAVAELDAARHKR